MGGSIGKYSRGSPGTGLIGRLSHTCRSEIDELHVLVAEIVAEKLAANTGEARGAIRRQQAQCGGLIAVTHHAILDKCVTHHLGRSAGGVNDHDPRICNALDRVLEQGKMRAAKDDGVGIVTIGFIEVALHDRARNIAVAPALLSQRHEHLTGMFTDDRLRVESGDRLAIGTQAYGGLRRQHEVPAAWMSRSRSRRTRLNHADYWKRGHRVAQGVECHGRGCIAGYNEQLDALLLQLGCRLGRISLNRYRALGAIRQARRVTQVNQVFVGQRFLDGLEDGQPTDAGVEYANGQIALFVILHTRIVPKVAQLWNNSAQIFGRLGIEVQKVLYGVVGSVILLVLIGFALPRVHSVEVSTEIDAQQATIFALVNDFRRFTLWSPWTDTDPNARFIYSGNSRGTGATVTWDGTILGSGTQTITQSRPFEYVGIVMSPGEPGQARSWFRLEPGVGTTLVHWGFEADYGLNIVGRYFASMLGGVVARDYEAGLANLKELAESLPIADFSDIEIEHLVVEPMDIAYLPTTSRPEPAAISEAMGKSYFQILNFIDEHNLQDAGAPLSITRTFSGSALVFDSAIPVRGVTDETPKEDGGVKLGSTYGGLVIRVRHTGSYRDLNTTHRKITAYLAALGLERNGDPWESYVSDPGNTPEKDLLTYVYYPIRQT